MKRSDFEEMVEGVLANIADDMLTKPTGKSKGMKRGIGGLRYGEAERKVAKAVSLLAALPHKAKPMHMPSPEMVPPCF